MFLFVFFFCKINTARLYIILRICFALHKDIEINFIPKCEALAFKDVFSPLHNSVSFYVHLGKYDFSFTTEYCFISHKSLDREKTSPKNIPEILIYFRKCVDM